jgi:hypothetical protein
MSTDKKPVHMSWEDFAELKIREAQQDGHFAELSGFGQPIANLDDPFDEQWWIKEKLKREGYSVLPPSLEIKRDVERTLAKITEFVIENDVRREVRALNVRIREANYRSVTGPPSTQMPVDEEEFVEQWRQMAGRNAS